MYAKMGHQIYQDSLPQVQTGGEKRSVSGKPHIPALCLHLTVLRNS